VRRWLAVFAIAFGLVLTSAPASIADFGYRDTGTDPDDADGGDTPDIRGSTRKVWEDTKGRHWFTMTLRAYEPLGELYGISVWLDTRRGPHWDVNISFVNIEGPPYCGLNWRHGGGWTAPIDQVGERATCVFRLRHLRANKRIRWRASSAASDGGPPFDRAPDRGFYS
jgi:hypothetical protein